MLYHLQITYLGTTGLKDTRSHLPQRNMDYAIFESSYFLSHIAQTQSIENSVQVKRSIGEPGDLNKLMENLLHNGYLKRFIQCYVTKQEGTKNINSPQETLFLRLLVKADKIATNEVCSVHKKADTSNFVCLVDSTYSSMYIERIECWLSTRGIEDATFHPQRCNVQLPNSSKAHHPSDTGHQID